MTKNDFKYAAISLLLINIWTLYGFFDYYTDTGMLSGLGLLVFFGYSLFIASVLGFVLLLSRFFYFKKAKKNRIINHFFYVFAGLFNLNLFIIWTTSIILKVLNLYNNTIFYAISSLLIS
ncbi:MAG: hypothetical protein KA133_12185, partial [Flavobacterium sp.]|nr:hypothetical protein [Flavobacterium sp.]